MEKTNSLVYDNFCERQVLGVLLGYKGYYDLFQDYCTEDVFFNPTREDNYPTVNLEAEACGTPVVTYNTGGCSETLALISDSQVADGYDASVEAIKRLRIAEDNGVHDCQCQELCQ